MLHTAAAEIVPHVKQEKIFSKRRSAHQRNIIIHNALDRVHEARAVAGISMNDNANRSSAGLRPKFVEMADFHRGVNQRVIAWGDIGAGVVSFGRFGGVQFDRHAPALRDIAELHFCVLSPAVRRVQKQHGKI